VCDSCRSLDTDVFFPHRPIGTDPLTTRRSAVSHPAPLESRHSLRCATAQLYAVPPGQSLSTKPRPESRMPVKVTRWPGPGRLPSPCRPHQTEHRSRPGCDPGSGSVLDVASSEGLGHLTVVPPSRLGSIYPPRCLPRELLGPTSPDDFCSLSRPADTSANPDPRRRAAAGLATHDRPPIRAPHPAQRGGGRDAG